MLPLMAVLQTGNILVSSVGIDLNPTLMVTLGDMQGDDVDWRIKTNATGSWSVVDSGTVFDGNGTVSALPTTMSAYNTSYYWKVNAFDGSHWENKTFCFMTKAAPGVCGLISCWAKWLHVLLL